MPYRRIFLENWAIKLISLLLALMLWFYVTSKGKSETTLSVPLELQNIPHGQIIVGDVVGRIEVRVQGKDRTIREITSGNKVFSVLDLSHATLGENIIRLSPDDIRRPAGVSVTRISPHEFKVILEPLVKKPYKLKVRLWGSPAAGFTASGISVKPLRVTAEGPQSVMQAIETVQTMPIDINGARDNIIIEPKIDYEGKPFKIIDPEIVVKISVVRKSGPR